MKKFLAGKRRRGENTHEITGMKKMKKDFGDNSIQNFFSLR